MVVFNGLGRDFSEFVNNTAGSVSDYVFRTHASMHSYYQISLSMLLFKTYGSENFDVKKV